MDRSRPHDWAFSKWAAAGFLTVFGFIAQFTIGLPFLVAGVVFLVLLVRRPSQWPANLGAIAGAGLVCLLIAVISAISGNVSPVVCAIVGLVLSGSACASFWWLRCRPRVA